MRYRLGQSFNDAAGLPSCGRGTKAIDLKLSPNFILPLIESCVDDVNWFAVIQLRNLFGYIVGLLRGEAEFENGNLLRGLAIS